MSPLILVTPFDFSVRLLKHNNIHESKNAIKNGVIIRPRETARYFNKLCGESIFKPMKNPIAYSSITFYCRKHHFITSKLNEVLQNLISTGHIEFWNKPFRTMQFMDEEKRNGKRLPDVLSLQHLKGIFVVAGVLHLIAIFVFTVESMSERVPFLRMILDHFY